MYPRHVYQAIAKLPHPFHFSVFDMRGFELQRPDAIGAGHRISASRRPASLVDEDGHVSSLKRDFEDARNWKRPQVQNPDKVTSGSGSIDEQGWSFVGVVIYNKSQH